MTSQQSTFLTIMLCGLLGSASLESAWSQASTCDALVVQSIPSPELDAACGSSYGCPGGHEWVTLRFYAKPDASTSEVYRVFGNTAYPLQIVTESEAYNSAFGLLVNSQGECDVINNECTESDSYMTIGLTEEAGVSGVSGAINPEIYPAGNEASFGLFAFDEGDVDFITNNVVPLNLSGPVEMGWQVDVDDVLPQNCKPNANGLVLLAQVTVELESRVYGQINYAMYPDGDLNEASFSASIPFDIPASTLGLDTVFYQEGSDPDLCLFGGCTDETACNFEIDALINDGSCWFPSDSSWCDCNANVEDALGICGGDCALNLDNDCFCDDPSSPEPDLCTNINACNYFACESLVNDTCAFFDCSGNCGGTDNSCAGCTSELACNYSPSASEDDGSCEFESCAGCTSPVACNYDATATLEDNSCDYSSCAGCTYPGACNFDPSATLENGSCEFTSCAGCTSPEACNFDSSASINDGSCDYSTCAGCDGVPFSGLTPDNCGVCGGDNSSCTGCTDPGACNYDATATIDQGCEYETCAGCDGIANSGLALDACGVCGGDGTSCLGCTYADACNFNPSATIEDGSCEYLTCAGCDGVPFSGLTPDDCGICGGDNSSCTGCTDSAACNYNCNATIDDGGCDFSCLGCTDTESCNFDSSATIDDGSCEYNSCAGCTYADACNFNPGATIEDGSCEYLTCAGCDGIANSGLVIDDCGVCGGDNSSCTGCTDQSACNFDPTATIDQGCEYGSCAGCDGIANSGLALDACGVCGGDGTSCLGCTYADACNFDASATIDDGSCEYETCAGCDGIANSGLVVDDCGVCGGDNSSCTGCTDQSACNFDPTATIQGMVWDSLATLSFELVNPNNVSLDNIVSWTIADTVFNGAIDSLSLQLDPGFYEVGGESLIDVGAFLIISDCYSESIDTLMFVDGSASVVIEATNGYCPVGCDYASCLGCTDASACNYDCNATYGNQEEICDYASCQTCTLDVTNDGIVGAADLLEFLTVFGQVCSD